MNNATTHAVMVLFSVTLYATATASTPKIEDLRQLDYVAEVTTSKVESPSRRIIHILDWHLIGKEHFDTETEYDKHLAEVEAVQRQHVKLLTELGTDVVYIEGVSPETLRLFDIKLRIIRNTEATLAEVKELAATDKDLAVSVAKLVRPHRIMLAGVGAAGQLALAGKLKALPAESHAEHEAARPKIVDGKLIKDDAANEKREAAIVRNVLVSDAETVVLILGGDHDLADNMPEGCEYLRVRVKGYPHRASMD